MISQAIFHCSHAKKHVRLTIDGGLGEIFYLELCNQCNYNHEKKFVIKEEVLKNDSLM